MLGKAVVTYCDGLIGYPPELNYTANSPDAYLAQIDRALAEPWNAERIRITYRWLAIEYNRCLIDISASFSANDSNGSTRQAISTRVIDRIGRVFNPDLLLRRDCRHRSPQLTSAGEILRLVESGAASLLDISEPEANGNTDIDEEAKGLRHEIGRLLPYLYAKGINPKAGTLHASLVSFVCSSPMRACQ